jgi:hypothetical protein
MTQIKRYWIEMKLICSTYQKEETDLVFLNDEVEETYMSPETADDYSLWGLFMDLSNHMDHHIKENTP